MRIYVPPVPGQRAAPTGAVAAADLAGTVAPSTGDLLHDTGQVSTNSAEAGRVRQWTRQQAGHNRI
jgi:hypothetical protein